VPNPSHVAVLAPRNLTWLIRDSLRHRSHVQLGVVERHQFKLPSERVDIGFGPAQEIVLYPNRGGSNRGLSIVNPAPSP
jgi:hypothetical protein